MQIVAFRNLSSSLGLALAMCFVAGCADDLDFSGLTDPPPPDVPPPPPPPPVFPLKAGDQVIYTGIGGRTEPCSGSEGQCDRVIRATYDIRGATLDEETNRWTLDAGYTYEMQTAFISASEIGALFLSKAAPFGDLQEGGSQSGEGVFRADGAPTDTMIANDFPFFHFETEYATEEGSAYRAAAASFQTRILEIDPAASLENQAAEAKLEAYFKDERGPTPMLHKVRVDLHPFGFICGWDERLTTWNESMDRSEGDFAGATIPVAAIFPGQVQLLRDDVRYQCSCFTKLCKNGNGDAATCLDPSDPDAPPGPCP